MTSVLKAHTPTTDMAAPVPGCSQTSAHLARHLLPSSTALAALHSPGNSNWSRIGSIGINHIRNQISTWTRDFSGCSIGKLIAPPTTEFHSCLAGRDAVTVPKSLAGSEARSQIQQILLKEGWRREAEYNYLNTFQLHFLARPVIGFLLTGRARF